LARISVGLAQVNQVVGDFQGNSKKIIHYIRMAKSRGADVVLFPELSVSGYPPEDLLLRSDFLEENERALSRIVKATEDILAVVGFVRRNEHIYNSAAIIYNKKIHACYDKIFLPNYGVFDEYRYFGTGRHPLVFTFAGVTFGMTVCEDIWYPDGPHVVEAASGAEIIVNISASPYHFGKWGQRENMISTRASDTRSFFAYCNMTGGQDELVFDGASLFVNESGEVVGRLPLFEETLGVHTIDTESVYRERLHDPRVREEERRVRHAGELPEQVRIPGKRKAGKGGKKLKAGLSQPPALEGEIFAALVAGTRDYVKKNGFEKVVIGLSGGIDSSFVACVAAEALGRENVIGVSMPSIISSQESIDDARELARRLGIKLHVVPIGDMYESFLKSLEPLFSGKKQDVTEENLQARIRGMILMSLSNKFRYMVLTTGNKSEMSVGYATLYGDMAGGFAVIKDVYKTMLYRLSRYYNERRKKVVIPERVLTKAPSAELRPDQLDTDTLPPYEVLDPILMSYIEDDCAIEEIVARGFPPSTVKKVVAMVDSNEYKRRQAPPGVRISQRGLGKDRRMPITNRFFGKS
jgi:NAD+ synthase (glutamine-hydrolysing)